jgi:hypothetical protein
MFVPMEMDATYSSELGQEHLGALLSSTLANSKSKNSIDHDLRSRRKNVGRLENLNYSL